MANNNGNASITVGNLVVNPGAVVNFTTTPMAPNDPVNGDLPTYGAGLVKLTQVNGATPTLTNGMLGGWAVVGNDFACWSPTLGVGALGNAAGDFGAYSTIRLDLAGPTDNVNNGDRHLWRDHADHQLPEDQQQRLPRLGLDPQHRHRRPADHRHPRHHRRPDHRRGRAQHGGHSVPDQPEQQTVTVNSQLVDNGSGQMTLVISGSTGTDEPDRPGRQRGLLGRHGHQRRQHARPRSTSTAVPASQTIGTGGLTLNNAVLNMDLYAGQIPASNAVNLNGNSKLTLVGNNTFAGLSFNNQGGTNNNPAVNIPGGNTLFLTGDITATNDNLNNTPVITTNGSNGGRGPGEHAGPGRRGAEHHRQRLGAGGAGHFLHDRRRQHRQGRQRHALLDRPQQRLLRPHDQQRRRDVLRQQRRRHRRGDPQRLGRQQRLHPGLQHAGDLQPGDGQQQLRLRRGQQRQQPDPGRPDRAEHDAHHSGPRRPGDGHHQRRRSAAAPTALPRTVPGVLVLGQPTYGDAISSYSGTTTIVNGTLKLASAYAIPATSGVVVNGSGNGLFDLAGYGATIGSLSGSGPVWNSGAAVTLTIGGDNSNQNYSGVLGTSTTPANIALTKIGSGTQVLSGSNIYTGVTNINAGTLEFAHQASLYAGTTASWTVANITVLPSATLALSVGTPLPAYFDSGALTTLLGNLAGSTATSGLENGAILGLDTTNAAGGTFTYANVIANTSSGGTNSLGLAKLGTGTLVLTASNTYTGGTTLDGGVLSLGNSGAVGSSGTITFGGGTLQFTSNNTVDYTNYGGVNRFSNAPNQAYNLDTNGQTVTLLGNLASSGGELTKFGAGTLVLGSAETYTGGTTINNGLIA